MNYVPQNILKNKERSLADSYLEEIAKKLEKLTLKQLYNVKVFIADLSER